MPKRTESRKSTWNRRQPIQDRSDIARSSTFDDDYRRPIKRLDIRREGPYETSYQIDWGYGGGRDVI